MSHFPQLSDWGNGAIVWKEDCVRQVCLGTGLPLLAERAKLNLTMSYKRPILIHMGLSLAQSRALDLIS